MTKIFFGNPLSLWLMRKSRVGKFQITFFSWFSDSIFCWLSSFARNKRAGISKAFYYVVVDYPIFIHILSPLDCSGQFGKKKEGNNQMLFTFWDHSITTAILLTTYKYIALGREKECVLSDFKFWILILLFLCLNWQFLQNESLIAMYWC